MRVLGQDLSCIFAHPDTFSLPPIDRAEALDVCQIAGQCFRHDPNLLELTGDFYIVGDLHGHVLELIRLLIAIGIPPAVRYLFLGDLVDRGHYSIATVVYILTLKCAFPDSVYLIRGNHEFESVNSSGGLLREIINEYGTEDLFSALNLVFAHIPIAARVNVDILCVHGGIAPQLKTVQQINASPKPLFAFSGGLADALLWSDPSPDRVIFRESPRGLGFEFGERALAAFLDANGLRLLVRGHQVITEGVRFEMERRLVTVFTISSYCERTDGVAGVLQIRAADHAEVPHILPWIPFVRRKAPANAAKKRRPASVQLTAADVHGMPAMVIISAMRGTGRRKPVRVAVPADGSVGRS
jgi:protein phosphatase